MTSKRSTRPATSPGPDYPPLALVDRRTVLLGVGALAAVGSVGCTNPAIAAEPTPAAPPSAAQPPAQPTERHRQELRGGGKMTPDDVPEPLPPREEHEAMSGKQARQDLPAPRPPTHVDAGAGVKVPPEPVLGGKPVPSDLPHPPLPPAGTTAPTKLGLSPGPATPVPSRPPRR